MINRLIAILKRCLQMASQSLRRLFTVFSCILRLRWGSHAAPNPRSVPLTEKPSFVAAMALPGQFLSPPDMGHRAGIPPLSRPASPADSGRISIREDPRSVYDLDSQPNTRFPSSASSGQFLGLPAQAVNAGFLGSPLPSLSADYERRSNYSANSDHIESPDRTARSITPSIASSPSRPASAISTESRRSRYRKYNGSHNSVRIQVRRSTNSLMNNASTVTVSNQLQPFSSHDQHLLGTGGHELMLPSGSQRNSPGPINADETSGAVSSEEIPIVDFCNIEPILPAGLERYKPFGLRKETISDYTIPTMTAYYPDHESEYPHRDSKSLPTGWQVFYHPEGTAFYYHEGTRLFTDLDMCDEGFHGDIMDYAGKLREALRIHLDSAQNNITEEQKRALENHSLLVVEPQFDDTRDEVIVRYYFVNPDGRSIFWLQEATHHFFNIQGVESMTHKKIAITAYYWKHWDLYPIHCAVDEAFVKDVKNFILHAKCGKMFTRKYVSLN